MTTQKTLRELIEHFDSAMLVVRLPEGTLRGLPMFIAKNRRGSDLWFITSRAIEDVENLPASVEVSVTLQSATRYLAIKGRATVQDDPQRVREMWRPVLYAWFDDKDDPDAILVRVVPEEAEYWDQSGLEGERYVIASAPPEPRPEGLGLDDTHTRLQL